MSKLTRLHIAKLLASQPNVMASSGELLQFFRSPQYDPDEESEGNQVESFLEFRGDLDKDIIESKEWTQEYLSNLDKFHEPSKSPPKKVLVEMEKQRKILEDMEGDL